MLCKMEQFLENNNLVHLAKTFEEQNITELGLLELLSEQEIEKLVMGNIGDKVRLRRGIANLKKVELETSQTELTSEENYEPPMKIQVIEKENLTEAITPSTQNLDLPIIFLSEPLHQLAPNYNSPSTSTVTLDSAFSITSENNVVVENISVKEIWTKDFLGQALLTKGQGPNGSLNNSDRDKLCDILVTKLLNVFQGKLTLHHFRVISKKKIEILPKEKKSTYFIEPILKKDSHRNRSEPARGKLIEKYRNKLYLIRKLENSHSQGTKGEECDKTDNGVFDQSVTDSKIWLSKNSTPKAEVLLHWKASYCLRKLSDNTTIADYFQEWPILKEDIAPELVAYDFEQLHSTAQLNVEAAFDAMFAEVYDKRKKTLTSTDDAIYSLQLCGKYHLRLQFVKRRAAEFGKQSRAEKRLSPRVRNTIFSTR
ncbi:unnamed protein product [Ceutorhynchus assimilis]|uniref:SAM domain-containing protein n=1 Tax=Ceutorhynchus assimilis TaxID=467358 RepID=A0A9N9MGG0_9CUCU|nr:unnamed protein product [Ceutorhynchus assimilis]